MPVQVLKTKTDFRLLINMKNNTNQVPMPEKNKNFVCST